MLQQSTMSVSAQTPSSCAETRDSSELLQRHATSMNNTRTLSSSANSPVATTTSRRHRGGNDNVVRAISPEGRRYRKPINGIQTKGFARSAQRRGSVLTLGPIERLQHFYAKRDLNVNKGGILGFKKTNGNNNNRSAVAAAATAATLTLEEEVIDDEDEDMLPEPPAPRPSWVDLDVETDLDVLLGHSFHDIQLTLTAWSMIAVPSELSDSDASSDNETSGYHIASLVHSVTRTIESVRNYTLHRSDLPDSALAKLRHASIQLLSTMKDLETRHQQLHGDEGEGYTSFDNLVHERNAIIRYLETVEEYALNPPHHIGAPPTTFSTDIRALMHKTSSIQTPPSSPALPDWLNRACYIGDNLGRYCALLEDNRQSILGGVPELEPIPNPNEDEEAFLKYLADGQILCNAYNNIVNRSRRPFGFINKIHQETGRTFRAIENLRFFSAACKFRFDLSFQPFEPSEVARKTDRGLIMLKSVITAFCECVIAELRESVELTVKSHPYPVQHYQQNTMSKLVENNYFASIAEYSLPTLP